jgi:hypothetical protein
MTSELHSYVEKLKGCVGKVSIQRQLREIIDDSQLKNVDNEALHDRLIEDLCGCGVQLQHARSYVCSAFKAKGIRFKAVGQGRRSEGFLVKDKYISCLSGIRQIEQLFGVTTDDERVQLADFLVRMKRNLVKKCKRGTGLK